jgi:DivIVA domain-containing protein
MLGPNIIASKRFLMRWRGYDTQEVEAFLRAVADDQQRLIQYLSQALSGADMQSDDVLGAALRGPQQGDPLLELNRITTQLSEIVNAARQSAGPRRPGTHRERAGRSPR